MAQVKPIEAQPVQAQPVQAQPIQGQVVVTTQGVQAPHPMMGSTVERWGGGLFSCFDDINSCLMACCCPCVSVGQIGAFAVAPSGQPENQVHCCAFCCGWLVCSYCRCCIGAYGRGELVKKISAKQQAPEQPSFFMDAALHWCCSCCVISQELRAKDQFQKAYGALGAPDNAEMER